jgi:hypothetical protein
MWWPTGGQTGHIQVVQVCTWLKQTPWKIMNLSVGSHVAKFGIILVILSLHSKNRLQFILSSHVPCTYSKMSANFFQTTWYHIHDNIHHSDCCESIKFHVKFPAFKKHKYWSLYSQNLNPGPYYVCCIVISACTVLLFYPAHFCWCVLPYAYYYSCNSIAPVTSHGNSLRLLYKPMLIATIVQPELQGWALKATSFHRTVSWWWIILYFFLKPCVALRRHSQSSSLRDKRSQHHLVSPAAAVVPNYLCV